MELSRKQSTYYNSRDIPPPTHMAYHMYTIVVDIPQRGRLQYAQWMHICERERGTYIIIANTPMLETTDDDDDENDEYSQLQRLQPSIKIN